MSRLVWVLMVLVVGVFAGPAAAQSCRWDGTAPFCDGECGGGEMELTRLGSIPDFWVPPFTNGPSFGAACLTGSKALCCKSPGGGMCRWEGTAPFCDGQCQAGMAPATPPEGSYNGSACWTGSKVYCCTTPTGTTGQRLVAEDCRYGPDTCAQGFVWREARRGDHVCVSPATRDQVRADNARAAVRRTIGGAGTCATGLVWREAYPGDHVCVSPATRSQTEQDNVWVRVRDACQ